MSRCKKVGDLLGAYIYGDLHADEMREVRVHAGECTECAAKLAAMTRTVQLIPSELPTLTDEEKYRISWAVKGAIRAKEQPKRFFLFTPTFARGFAVVAIATGAFFAGMALKKPEIKREIVKVPGETKIVVRTVDARIPAEPDTSEKSPSESLTNEGVPSDWFDRRNYNEPIYRHRYGYRTPLGDPTLTLPWDGNSGAAPSIWEVPGVAEKDQETSDDPQVALGDGEQENHSEEQPNR